MLTSSIACAALDNPVISSPKFNDEIGNVISASWKTVRGAKSYQLCIREYGASNCTISRTLRAIGAT